MSEPRGRRPGFSLLPTALALAVLAAGCGPAGRGTLSGSVTLDGQPLALGAISLEPLPAAAGEATGGLVRDGRYELTGKAAPRVGRYRVAITASPTATGRTVPDPTRPPGSLAPELIGGTVAARFNTETTLSVEIDPGPNTADFAVESK
jgi:hypothetical protein